MKNIYPLRLSPVTKDIIWGGDRLPKCYGIGGNAERVAEAWLLTLRHDGMSVIENGDYAGKTLREYFDSEGDSAICEDFSLDRFPLLIKFIDAKKDLSIQVHPDDNYAIPHENEFGKTEMWYIISADPGARIVYGLRPGVTKEDFLRAVDTEDYESVLNYKKVHAGETYFIPAGLVHAIGEGILIAEIQQNSNITYRIYDYGRPGADGKPRPLHTEAAKAVVKCFSEEEIAAERFSSCKSRTPGLLASCRLFKVKLSRIKNGEEKLCAGRDSFHSLIFLDGEGYILFDGEEYPVKKGESYYIPAGLGEYSVITKSSLSFIVSSVR